MILLARAHIPMCYVLFEDSRVYFYVLCLVWSKQAFSWLVLILETTVKARRESKKIHLYYVITNFFIFILEMVWHVWTEIFNIFSFSTWSMHLVFIFWRAILPSTFCIHHFCFKQLKNRNSFSSTWNSTTSCSTLQVQVTYTIQHKLLWSHFALFCLGTVIFA